MKIPLGKVLVVLAFLALAAYFVNEAFESWDKSPSSTSISSVPIQAIPFPAALTICPEHDSRWLTILNYVTKHDKDAKEVLGNIYSCIQK